LEKSTLEEVQRRAFKCALGNIGQDIPYEERLKLLKWPILSIRIIDKWNNLPKEIAEAENLNIFKNRLKFFQ